MDFVDRAAALGVFSGMGDRKMVITASALTRTHVVQVEVSLPLVPQLVRDLPEKYRLPEPPEPAPPKPPRTGQRRGACGRYC
jgi:hypothetical protein